MRNKKVQIKTKNYYFTSRENVKDRIYILPLFALHMYVKNTRILKIMLRYWIFSGVYYFVGINNVRMNFTCIMFDLVSNNFQRHITGQKV